MTSFHVMRVNKMATTKYLKCLSSILEKTRKNRKLSCLLLFLVEISRYIVVQLGYKPELRWNEHFVASAEIVRGTPQQRTESLCWALFEMNHIAEQYFLLYVVDAVVSFVPDCTCLKRLSFVLAEALMAMYERLA